MADGFTRYRDALQWFVDAASFGIHPGLEGIRGLLAELGDPQEGLPVIHVAGTNGKGSVTAYLRNVFVRAGYPVGCFNSPALRDYREQILYKGRMISQKDFTRLAGVVEGACAALTDRGIPHPSQFEMDLAMAFLFFREKGCDPVILECGMGGKEDATNITTSDILTIITSVSLDHCQFLGKTLASIAENKAGIMRRGVPVVTMHQAPEVLEVLERKALETGAKLRIAKTPRVRKEGMSLQRFDYPPFSSVEISMGGEWQPENAALALESIQLLRERYRITDLAVLRGMKETKWEGRFEILRKRPLLIADGAHNPDAARRLSATLQRVLKEKHMVFIVGMLRDKDIEGVLEPMLPLADSVIAFKPPGNPRAMDGVELAEIAGHFHKRVTSADSLEEALEEAELLSGKDGAVVAFGSLSFIGKLKGILQVDQRPYRRFAE